MKNFLINVLFPSYALTILTSPKDNISKLEIFHKSVSYFNHLYSNLK